MSSAENNNADNQPQQQEGLSEEDKKLAVRLAQIIENSNEKCGQASFSFIGASFCLFLC